MHIYGDGEHSVNAWNAVDVLIDGLYHHGLVLDAGESGLTIDFQCPDQHSQFIHYRSIFDNSCAALPNWFDYIPEYPALEQGRGTRGASVTMDVEVLLRTRSNRPWVWYPARLDRTFDSYTMGLGFHLFVEVHCGNDVIRTVLPRAQVRFPLSPEERKKKLVRIHDFVTRSVALPSSCAPSISPVLLGLFARDFRGNHFIRVEKDHIVYLQRQGAPSLDPQNIKKWFERNKQSIQSYIDKGEKFPNEARICRRIPTWKAPEVPDPPHHHDRLPPILELLTETLEALSTVDRVRCRRVCALWNDILTTEKNLKEVRVSYRDSIAPDLPWDAMYTVAATLLKYATHPSTEKLVIADVDEKLFSVTILLLEDVLKRSAITTVILANWQFGISSAERPLSCYTGAISQHCRRCAGLYDTLVWKNCRVMKEDLSASIPLCITQLASGGAEKDLWNAWENSVVLPEAMSSLSEWIKLIGQQNEENQENEELCDLIVQVLCEYQSLDPRVPVHYRDQGWTDQNLESLDVTKLTRITLYQLCYLRQKFGDRSVVILT
ncbi:uncharacterized protein LOC129586598 [Paramacrobiotus metropolitanus]|uniref:uncharacterized protein LOC129586598 n=1 Tax=Paramacrobiotus metropolitanus TaxID=2943436 RepID=UPI0024459CE6|nr:uncharacterized protein LOC129586598 [Paramacrobiotus metropolitanus]